MYSIFKKVVSKAKITGLHRSGLLRPFSNENKPNSYQKRQHGDEVEMIDKDSLHQIGGEEPVKIGKTYEEYAKERKEFEEKERAITQDILDSQIKDDKTPF